MVEDMLAIMERVRVTAAKMMKIWAWSAMANGGRDAKIESIAKAEKKMLKLVEEGKLRTDDLVDSSMSP
jgi:hypothetical protein